MLYKKKYISKLAVIALLLSCISGIVSSVRPSLAKTITIEKGKTYKLKIKKGSKIKCSNKKIAKVTNKGKIKALKKGKCTVKVVIGNKVKKYNISVRKPKNKDNTSPLLTAPPDIQVQTTPSPTRKPPAGYVFFTGMVVEKIEPKDEHFSIVYLVCEKYDLGLPISEEIFNKGVRYIRFETLSSSIIEGGIAPGDKVYIGYYPNLIHKEITDNMVNLYGEGNIVIGK